MEAVVSVGKSVLNGLLSGAKSAIAEEAALTQSVQRDAVFLADELAAMQSYLRDADEERNRHKVPRSRVKQVRLLAYDVEDCLQEYSVRLEKQSGWRLARTVLDRHRIAEEMKGLRSRVEDMSHRNLRYRLFEDTNYSNAEMTSARRFGEKRQVDLFLESEQVDLLPLIREKDQELRVIAVWGASGDPRKMSIVRRAYDDLNRHKKFGCYAWIRVTHPISPSEFLHRIMRQFYMNYFLEEEEGKMKTQEETTVGAQVLKKMEMMKQDALADEFNKHVSKKSYLIVLNDLSTIEDWDWIKTYFPNNKKGSRIIVSTEQAEVASLCAGPDKLVVELKQSSASQTIYAFCEKGTTEPGASSTAVAAGSISPPEGSGSRPNNLIETTMDVDALKESHLIGRQELISEVINLLCHKQSQDQREVISICGKSGLGKTILVKHIYQHYKLDGIFDKRAYVTIKRPFDRRELISSLATQLLDGNKVDQIEAGAKTKLGDLRWSEKNLSDKKYLIVLDDLSSTTEWDAISKYFPKTNQASRIIVTTGGEDIAKYCSQKDENIFRLKSLENGDVRDLFIKKVFGSIIKLDEQYPELAGEAKSILKKCNGSPIAIIAIGGHLAKRPKTVAEWRKLNEYIGAEVDINQGPVTTRTILTKCYDSLPYDLKSCFLYLSIFPEDYNISRRRMVRRWTAEGYSSEVHGGKDAKETADSYFMELMERSMIEPFVESIGSTKVINSCKVNDHIHKISTSKSMEENLVFRLEEGCSLNTHVKIRHLAVVSDKWEGGQTEFENIVNRSSIRSLTVFGKWCPFFISEKMRMLRVLDLESTSGLNDHHLEHIGKLLQLKYLSLRGCRDICYLPNSFGNLRQLETMDIKHTAIIKLPKAITKLRKLQYLRVGGLGAFGGRSYEELVDELDLPKLVRKKLCLLAIFFVACCVSSCAPQISMSTWETGGRPNRRDVCTAWCCTGFPFLTMRLDARGVVVPSGFNKLNALHTLGAINIGHGNAVLQDIRRLTRLRKLGVVGVNLGNREEFCLALCTLSNLESLSVRSVGAPGLDGCLESDGLVYSPPVNLKSLKLDGNLVKFPKWISELRNLVKLSLRNSKLEEHENSMGILGRLQNLTILRLQQKSFQGEELSFTFHGRGGAFPSLKVLQLILVGGLKSVKFQEGAMPKLELLQFCGLPWITGADFFSGLDSLPSLKRFLLDDDAMYRKDFVEGLRNQLDKNTKTKPTLKRYS